MRGPIFGLQIVPRMQLCFQQVRRHRSDYMVSTPIFYVNSAPHIGHLYSALLADAHYRFRKLQDPSLTGIFSTGTDEHGLKIQQAAASKGISPSELCNDVSNKFRTLFDGADISYTDFIRTTEPRHKKVVDEIWRELYSSGFLYKDVYSSWYSVQDESFLTSTQVEERDGIHYSLESGHQVEWAEEENWCFRLKDQRENILKWIHDTNPIQPAQFQGQVLAWLEDERFGDLSVSRPASRLSWGVPVPNLPGQQTTEAHTVYVWLDALSNYLTVAGYRSGWTGSCIHVIGKDILKFHAIYWPAFLSALNLPLPERLLVHSHWMVDDVKMSKSIGNVLDPHQLIDKYTVDGTRYMLLREGVPHADGNFNNHHMLQLINHELADTLGNLLNRSSSKGVNPKQIVPEWRPEFKEYETDISRSLIQHLESLADSVSPAYEAFNFYQGIVMIMDVLRLTNSFVQDEKPWELKKTDLQKLDFVLALSLESLRICGILLSPIVPGISNNLLNKLQVPVSSRSMKNCSEFAWSTQPTEKLSLKNLHEDKIVLFKKIRE